jgi:hypothetical protein
MVVTVEPLFDKGQTCSTIFDISKQYANDLYLCYSRERALSELNPNQIYNIVRLIEYEADIPGTEVVMRPIHVIRHGKADCKKKTTILSSYAILRGIPFRYACTSKKADGRIHHIFPQYKILGRYINFDATYPWYYIGEPKVVTNVEYFNPVVQ